MIFRLKLFLAALLLRDSGYHVHRNPVHKEESLVKCQWNGTIKDLTMIGALCAYGYWEEAGNDLRWKCEGHYKKQ